MAAWPPLRSAWSRMALIRIEKASTSAGTYFADFSICAQDSGGIHVLDAFASHIRLEISGSPGFGGLIDLGARMHENVLRH